MTTTCPPFAASRVAHLGAGAALCIRGIAVSILPVVVIVIIIIAPACAAWPLYVMHGAALEVMRDSRAQNCGKPVAAASVAARANTAFSCALPRQIRCTRMRDHLGLRLQQCVNSEDE